MDTHAFKENLINQRLLKKKDARRLAMIIGKRSMPLSPKIFYVIEEPFGWIYFITHKISYKYSKEFPMQTVVVILVDAVVMNAYRVLGERKMSHPSMKEIIHDYVYVYSKAGIKSDNITEYKKVENIISDMDNDKKLSVLMRVFFNIDFFLEKIIYFFRNGHFYDE